ncbi:MAG: acyltransferase [Clostridia bacterium]|nr:acyltransferase [Clostridia bacterium]
MNKYIRTMFCLPFGMLKMAFTKVFHIRTFKGSLYSVVSPFTEISLEYGAKLNIGRKFRMRDGAKIRVRKGAECKIGKNVSVNSNNMIACHESIFIGDNIQFGPNVQIYDHDHDFRAEGGVSAMKYKTAPVEIGNNVWVGANVVILRGTKIGDNCVVGAGAVIKGNYPDNSIIVQKRVEDVRAISKN